MFDQNQSAIWRPIPLPLHEPAREYFFAHHLDGEAGSGLDRLIEIARSFEIVGLILEIAK
ncbi:MAG TPA: hypothetical protein VIX59_06875 [Candidatus Binataceae bacterium]